MTMMTDLPISPPSIMKAWLYSTAAGGLEKNLTLDSTARGPPALRPDQVLIKVISASINPADYKVPEMGTIVTKILTNTPATPGMDFCGRIAAVGADNSSSTATTAKSATTQFDPGQLVYGSLGKPSEFGSLGEYLVCGTGEIAALLPEEGVNPDHASTVGVAGQTAYQSVAPYLTGSPDERVFINAGSGGCGMFAIQVAKALGCRVTTTCSTRNVQFCKDLGADEVIDYTSADVVEVLKSHGQVYSHAVDHVDTPSNLYRECHHFLLPGKTFVQVGATSIVTFADRLLRPGVLGGGKRRYSIFFFKNNQDDLVQIGKWMQEGKIKVAIDSVFEFGDVVKAFEKLRSGRSRGKIVIHVSES